jgi:hypothetical protein
METVQQIERAIDALTPEQREQLYLWLDEHYLQPSDIQLKAAIDAGRFDERIARAVADHKAGRTEPLAARDPASIVIAFEKPAAGAAVFVDAVDGAVAE